MKKTTIDTNILPNIWLTWTTTKAVFYMNCATGVKQNDKPDIDFGYKSGYKCMLINSGSRPRFGYAKYHEDLEMLELAEVTIDTTRKEDIKQWCYAGDKYFLKKDKTILDENGKVKTEGFNLSLHHHSRDFKTFLSWFYRISTAYNVAEFKKFLGADTYTVGSGRIVDVTHAWHIQEWYKTKQKARSVGKQQKLTNKLVEIPLTEIDIISEKHPVDSVENRNYWSRSGIIYFESLTDGWHVLRVLCPDNNNKYVERERMYINDDGTNRIVAPSKDGWFPSKQLRTYGYYNLVNADEATTKCNRLKYIWPLINEVEKNAIRNVLISILRFPEIEQMIRLGYSKAALWITSSNTVRADLKYMFGDYYNDKETTLLRKTGLTKHQLDKYMQVYNSDSYYNGKCATALKEMRKLFGDGLLHLDNTSFNKYFDGFMQMNISWKRGAFYQLDDMNIDRVKFIKNAFRLGEKHNNIYTVLNDTINAYNRLNTGTHPEINWYFDSYSDVVRAHNAIDELRRAQEAERRAMWDMEYAERLKKEEEKRIKVDEKRKEYEYEDDSYVIRLPKDSNEIIREGNMQHICIGGYTTRHAYGQTNLFFLRRKSDPEAPFYAIEMDSTKRIVQIHGFGNRWLGCNPEAIPTVVRWLRKNGIKCDEKILTCKATGYCSVNEYVPMPVVD